MSTIVQFRRVRDEVALGRLVPHDGEGMRAPTAPFGAKDHIAEIILLPRIFRPAQDRVRKPLKRRFALRAAAVAMQQS